VNHPPLGVKAGRWTREEIDRMVTIVDESLSAAEREFGFG
jgi:hypothetical protein